jgi:creatinine amidohydrolase
MIADDYSLRTVTSERFAELVAHQRVAILVPLGSVEPHGPHLSLLTDLFISEAAAVRAAPAIAAGGMHPFVAPAVPYGVTDCAQGFAGAVSVAAEVLTAYLCAVVEGYLTAGVAHVCLINNHLEPAQDAAVRAAVAGHEGRASVACPLERRWARTLSDEFKRGACHAGQYETSIVMAAMPAGVDDAQRAQLPEVPISLSDGLGRGLATFRAMGMDRAYAGAPAAASAAEGHLLLDKLAAMIAATVLGQPATTE